jgi:hypothetical protein
MTNKLLLLALLVPSIALSSELVHEFKSPAFSGIGYSSHVLTIEQLESNRKKAIKDEQKAAEEKADRDIKGTNAYKFKNNLESRIYAQLSKQISDNIFGDAPTWAESTTYSNGALITYNGKQWKSTDNNNTTVPGGTNGKWIENNANWVSTATPFGDTIQWKRVDSRIFVEVRNSNNDIVAEFDVPVGEFAF